MCGASAPEAALACELGLEPLAVALFTPLLPQAVKKAPREQPARITCSVACVQAAGNRIELPSAEACAPERAMLRSSTFASR